MTNTVKSTVPGLFILIIFGVTEESICAILVSLDVYDIVPPPGYSKVGIAIVRFGVYGVVVNLKPVIVLDI